MFYSSLFFPKKIRNDVFICYAFVRRADDLVDSLPKNNEEFYRFKHHYDQAKQGIPTGDIVIDSFVDLENRKRFDPSWTEAFLYSMELDLTKTSYNNLQELLAGRSENPRSDAVVHESDTGWVAEVIAV